MKTRTRLVALGLVAMIALGLAACSSDDATTTDTTAAIEATTTSGDAAPTTEADGDSTATTPASDGADTTEVATSFDVNTASQEEIAAVLTAAGVPNAEQWAREVVEYRPYDMSDPDMAHLRDELAKYNPAAGVVDQIVAALQS